MKTATCYLKSASPYSQSRHIDTPKKDRESADDYEKRTWRERLHVNGDGHVVISPMSFANCVKEAAKYLSIQIPGKGKSTYTKHFESGVMVLEPLVLASVAADVPGEWLFVPADGIRGSGKRVMKCFPKIEEWEGEVKFWVLDDTITQSVFEQVLRAAGLLIGLGRFRPRNCGIYGRFNCTKLVWEEANV